MKKITLILIFCFFYTFSISNANILNTRETRDFNFAVELFDKDINLAIEQFENFIKKYPRSSYLKDAYFWIGIGHLNLENFQDAAIKFQFIVDNFSKSDKYSPALYNLGLTYYKLSNFLLSAEYFQKFINIEKNKTKKSDFFAAALNYLGDCYFNLAKYQDAEKTYFEYLALSKNPEVEYKYFKALIHNKNYQAAYNFYNLTKFDTAINFDDSEYIKFSIYLGDIAAALNNFNEAISYYSKALANENSELINLIFLKLSQIYYSLKKPDESIEFLKKLANSKFENFKSEADYKIALIYYELKNYHSAIFHLKKSIENYPEDRFSEKINILVNLYYTIDDYQKVAETYEKHIKSNEKFNLITNIDLRIKIAYSYFKINQFEQALQLSSNLTISKSPQYYNLKYIELLAYYNLKDYFRVITEIKLLLLDDKLSDSFKYKFKKLLADSYFDIKDYGAAEKHYTELINLEHPEFNHYDILAALGVTYLKQNKFDFAELLIKNILAENTQTSLKFQQFILLFCETINNEIKSEYYLNELLKITNNAIISDKANFMLAQLNFKNKNYNISINNLKKISENYLTNDRYYLFALNYYNLKNYVNSIENLDKISDYSNDTNKIAKLYILNYYELQNYRNIIEKANLLSDAAELENKLFYSGIAHYYLKEFSTAKTLFEKFLENFNISTYYYQTLYYLAVCEFNLKNYDSALSLFLRLDASPEKNKFDYQKYLAYLYLQDNQNSKALQAINAFENNFKNTLTETLRNEINYIKTQIYFKQKNYNQALNFIAKISKPENLPFQKEYYLLYAEIHQALFQYAKANENYEKFLKIADDKSAIVKVEITIINNLFKLERFNDCVNYTENFFKKSPQITNDEKINLELQYAKSLFLLTKYDETIKYLSAKNYQDANFQLEKELLIANAHFNKKNYHNAIKLYLTILNNFPNSRYELDIRLALAQNYKLIGDTQNYELSLLNIINNISDFDLKNESIIELANFYYQHDNLDSSIFYSKKIIDTTQSKIHLEKSYRTLINSYYNTKDFRNAINYTNIFLNNNPNISETVKNEFLLLLAESYFSLNNFNEALKHYNSTRNPKIEDYLTYKKTLVYFNLEDFDNIIKESENFIKKFQNSQYIHEINYLLAFAYHKKNNLEKAVNIFIQTFDKINNETNKKIAAKIISDYYSSKKDAANTAKWLEKSIKLEATPEYDSLLSLANIYYDWKDYQNAINTFSQLIELYPPAKNNTEILSKLIYSYINSANLIKANEIAELISNKKSNEYIKLKAAVLEKSGDINALIKLYEDFINSTNLITDANIEFLNKLINHYNATNKTTYQNFLKSVLETKQFANNNALNDLTVKLADTLFENKNYSEALLFYWKIILENNAKNLFEYSYYKIILAYINLNDIQKAKIQYNKFIAEYPKSKYIESLSKYEVLK